MPTPKDSAQTTKYIIELWRNCLTCFTLNACPPHNTSASFRGCASPFIQAWISTSGWNRENEDHEQLFILLYKEGHNFFQSTYEYIEAKFHSTVHQTGRLYCLIPAVCSLHHRCRSLQSCRLYWRDYVDHLWEYQDHRSQWLERTNSKQCFTVNRDRISLWVQLQTFENED